MKEKVLFIAAIVGSFSATIVLLINNGLVLLGVDTSEYVNIINMVGMGLAVVILIASTIFLNKYSTLQQKQNVTQQGIVKTALASNANLLETLLPNLANQILTAAEERSTSLLHSTEIRINTMMNEMLPALAEQTMRVVTEKSQNIVEETTAKANETIRSMNELIPTYAKNISDNVAQTVRENNAHYHKMLIELKKVVADLPATGSTPYELDRSIPTLELALSKLEQNIEIGLYSMISKLLTEKLSVVDETDPTEDTQNDETDPTEDTQNDETDPAEDTQNDETDDKSNESITS